MKIEPSKTKTYTPKALGNRSLPLKEQVRVLLTFPSVRQARNIRDIRYSTAGDEVKIDYAVDRILKDHVTEIENLEIVLDGTNHRVTTGAQLLDIPAPGVAPLVDELVSVVMQSEEINEEQIKN